MGGQIWELCTEKVIERVLQISAYQLLTIHYNKSNVTEKKDQMQSNHKKYVVRRTIHMHKILEKTDLKRISFFESWSKDEILFSKLIRASWKTLRCHVSTPIQGWAAVIPDFTQNSQAPEKGAKKILSNLFQFHHQHDHSHLGFTGCSQLCQ